MKRILAPVLFVLLLMPSVALGETMKDLEIRDDGLWYKKFTDVPFTGKVTGGLKPRYRPQGSFRKGKIHGTWVKYNWNGTLGSKGTYKNGVRDGPYVTYYENGKLESKGTYKDGKLEGPWVYYNKDGTVDKELTGTYRNHKKISVVSSVFPSTGLTLNDLVEREGIWYKKIHHRKRTHSDVPFTGKTTGQYEWTFKNGKKHGRCRTWWLHGMLEKLETYKNGKYEGLYVVYSNFGLLLVKGYFKISKRDGYSRRDGFWVEYNRDGIMNKAISGTYTDGKKISD